jgi:hypothetical protein
MSRVELKRKKATKVNVEGQIVEVKLYNTLVVFADRERIILNSGGWRTVTTKARINQASEEFGLGVSVWQKDRNWFVTYKGKTIDFKDEMVLKR